VVVVAWVVGEQQGGADEEKAKRSGAESGRKCTR